jgi:hypothetical protein
MSHEVNSPGSTFKDRTVGLIVFGILQLLLGGLFALMVPFLILALVGSVVLFQDGSDSAYAAMNVKSSIFGLFFYAAFAAWFITMGIGSILARRWARALVLVTSWIWLIGGIGGFIAVVSLMPGMFQTMGEQGEIPPEMVAAMKYGMTGFFAFCYIVVPGLLVLFYQSKHVKATCKFKDPQSRWTDQCPLPLLALSILCGIWSISMLSTSVYGWMFPFFGTIATGLPGAASCIVFSALFGVVAWGVYRQDIHAWRLAVLMTIFWASSIAVTFSNVNFMDIYAQMDIPEEQLQIIANYDFVDSRTILAFSAVWFAALLGYLFYVKRFFHPSMEPGNS